MKSCLLSLVGLMVTCVVMASAQAPRVAVADKTGAPPPALATKFYPLKVGYRWTYSSVEPNSPNRQFATITIEVDREEVYERIVKNEEKGKDTVEKFMGFLLKSTSAGKTTFDHVVVMALDPIDKEKKKFKEAGVYRASVAGTPITPPVLFLKLPLETGETWDSNSMCGTKEIKGKFTWRTEALKIGGTEYKNALVVSLRDGPANDTRLEMDTWYAEGIGMVKQRVKAKKNEVVLELKDYNFKTAK